MELDYIDYLGIAVAIIIIIIVITQSRVPEQHRTLLSTPTPEVGQ